MPVAPPNTLALQQACNGQHYAALRLGVFGIGSLRRWLRVRDFGRRRESKIRMKATDMAFSTNWGFH